MNLIISKKYKEVLYYSIEKKKQPKSKWTKESNGHIFREDPGVAKHMRSVIRSAVRYHDIPSRMAIISKSRK